MSVDASRRLSRDDACVHSTRIVLHVCPSLRVRCCACMGLRRVEGRFGARSVRLRSSARRRAWSAAVRVAGPLSEQSGRSAERAGQYERRTSEKRRGEARRGGTTDELSENANVVESLAR